MAGLGDMFGQSFAAVNGQKPRNSDRIQAGQPLNLRGAFEAATNIPVVGDALSGGMAMYDAAKGDYGSAAMNALGVLPFLSAGMTKGVGKVADALGDRKMLTKFEQAHLAAQKNAALPVDQGGLGLAFDNTAMDRAAAMGFDTPALHASLSDIKEFSNDVLGKYNSHPVASLGTFFSDSPDALNLYLKGAKGIKGRQENIIPVLLNKGNSLEYAQKYKQGIESKFGTPDGDPINTLSGDIKNAAPWKQNNVDALGEDYDPYASFRGNVEIFNKSLNDKNIDSVILRKSFDMPESKKGRKYIGATDQYIIRDPSNIRSRFAAFDPSRRHDADLLGNIDPRLLGAMGIGSVGAAVAATQLPNEYKGEISNAFGANK